MPEQLLAAAQAAITAKGKPDWRFPAAQPVIDLIARVQQMAKTTEELLLKAIDASETTQKTVDDLHMEKSAVKRMSRAFKTGDWQLFLKAAMREHLDDLIS